MANRDECSERENCALLGSMMGDKLGSGLRVCIPEEMVFMPKPENEYAELAGQI